MLSRFHLVPERNGQTDGQTDRQTDLLYQYRASVCWRAIKTILKFLSNRFATLFLLICNRLMRCSSSVVNSVAVAALLLTSLLTKNISRKYKSFSDIINSAFRQLWCVKFSVKLADICRRNEENLSASFFRSRCRLVQISSIASSLLFSSMRAGSN